MARSRSPSRKGPYQRYGNLIHAWRNEIKHSLDLVARETGIRRERLSALESGTVKPTWRELECLAKQFLVSVRDLLPYEDDLDRGIRWLRAKDVRAIPQARGKGLHYTYRPRVMTSTLPNFKPLELVLHVTRRQNVVINRGHFFHGYTEVLAGGPVACLWEWENTVHEEIFHEGDSWFIPGFIPHGYYSPNPTQLGRILSITFGQHLTGDARQELTLMGKQYASRIVSDDLDYYPHARKQ